MLADAATIEGTRLAGHFDGVEHAEDMRQLDVRVADLLPPVYGREVTSQQPW